VKLPFDLNCDLGEGEPVSKTRATMRWIISANVACGGHAGTVRTMEECARLAREFRVQVGAHPGVAADFGRGDIDLSPSGLELLLLQQVGTLERIAAKQKLKLHHIKLHGSLYHATEENSALRRAYVTAVARWWPGVKIYARAGGTVAKLAKRTGVPVWREIFLDRGYNQDGTLIPRGRPGALMTDVGSVLERLRQLGRDNRLMTVGGKWLSLRAETLCIHSDTPSSARLAKAIADRCLGDRSGVIR